MKVGRRRRRRKEKGEYGVWQPASLFKSIFSLIMRFGKRNSFETGLESTLTQSARAEYN